MLTQRTRLIFLYILIFVGIIVLFALAWTMSQIHIELAVAIILGLAIGLLSFVRQDIAAIAILFSMVLSPELKLADMPAHEVVLRFDDIVLIMFFTSWLFKMAYFKNLGLLKVTALNLPMWSYIFCALISTWYGLSVGDVKLISCLLYFLKYIEYFMIFFMFSNIIQTEKQLDNFFKAFIVAAVVVGLYGYFEIISGVTRISAPFEGSGQPNTFGGYLLLIIGLTGMMAIYAPDMKNKMIFSIATILILPLLIKTLSRATYGGFAAMVPFYLFFAKPKMRILVAAVIVAGLISSPFVLPKKAVDRIKSPFAGQQEQVTPFMSLNRYDSSYSKAETTAYIMTLWEESPIIGRGVTGVGLVDTQYPRVLGETGIMGSLAFAWIIISVFQVCRVAIRYMSRFPGDQEWRWKSLTYGLLCGFIGILIHGIGANTFILIRVMEPLWFLTAVVTSIPHVLENKYKPVVIKPPIETTYQVFHTGHESY